MSSGGRCVPDHTSLQQKPRPSPSPLSFFPVRRDVGRGSRSVGERARKQKAKGRGKGGREGGRPAGRRGRGRAGHGNGSRAEGAGPLRGRGAGVRRRRRCRPSLFRTAPAGPASAMMIHGFQSSHQDFTFGPWKLTAAKTHIMKSADVEK